MNVCFIGNSHLAAIKRAWDTRDADRPWKATFFGSSGNSLETLHTDGASLIAADDDVRQIFKLTAGTDRIELEKFDLFVWSALAFEIRDFYSIFAHSVLLADSALKKDRPLLSGPAFRRTLEDILDYRPGRRVLGLIQQKTGKPVVWIPSPCPCELIVRDKAFAPISQSVKSPFVAALYGHYRQEADALAARQGWHILPQDPATLRIAGLTLKQFSTGSRDAGWTKDTVGTRQRGDQWHMNARYGDIVLQRLAALQPSPVY